jgi:prepilin-type N-terminal cleavage/methylation domain-containing protein
MISRYGFLDNMKELWERIKKDQSGFTLIELLVVVLLLGVLAAVVILSVFVFIGEGTLESANSELHQAQTAIASCMSESGVVQLDEAVAGWDGSAVLNCPTCTSNDGEKYLAAQYLKKRFKGLYDVDIDGTIINGTNNKWPETIEWDSSSASWKEV